MGALEVLQHYDAAFLVQALALVFLPLVQAVVQGIYFYLNE
jgi:hypothetical protein